MKNKAKVLIVEDESIIALNIKKAVENFGLEVIDMVSNKKDALHSINIHEPNIIIMDILLEDNTDGIELVNQIYKIKKIPVIYLTGQEKDEIINRAIKTYPIGYLTKPFRKTELKSILKLAIYKKKQKRDNKEEEYIDLGLGYKFNNEKMHLYYQNEIKKLSSNEAKLLFLLVRANGALVTFETIESFIWENEFVTNDAIRLLASRLRKKLEFGLIETVYGYGFKIRK